MALYFVSTSTTTSSDGISFDTEHVKESQEIIQARRDADAASKKSLFEQLTDQQDKKKEEYDKNTKLIFAPPKCLDEEDVEYFAQVDERHKQFLDSQKEMDNKQLEEFRKKSQTPSAAQQHPLLKLHQKKEQEDTKKKTSAPVAIVVKRKKKKDDTSNKDTKRIKALPQSEAVPATTSISAVAAKSASGEDSAGKSKRSVTSVSAAPPQSSLSSLLGAYDSDSD